MDLPAFGDTVTSAGGFAGTLAGTIATDGAIDNNSRWSRYYSDWSSGHNIDY